MDWFGLKEEHLPLSGFLSRIHPYHQPQVTKIPASSFAIPNQEEVVLKRTAELTAEWCNANPERD